MPDETQDTRPPVMTLWAAMAAEWLQCDPDPVVMPDSGAAGSDVPVTPQTTGVNEDELSHQAGPSTSATRR